jgi:Uma2 family endonuclease
MISNINQLDLDKNYSYADYFLWKFHDRIELFKGKIFKMSPAPSSYHQRVSSNLHRILWNIFNKHSYNLFCAPFDVRLLDRKKSTIDKEIYTVVQPDLCVMSDINKIDEKGAIGSADLIIEILSPDNSKKEMKYKFDLYEEAGVLEYGIVNPADKTIFIFVLKENQFSGLHPLIEEDTINSPLFPQLDFCLEDIFN